MDIIEGFEDIQEERSSLLNEEKIKERNCILYWMQRSQRSEYNHALEYSILMGDRLEVPVVALFCLTDRFEDANLRHYRFMLEGLKETENQLEERGIGFWMYSGDPKEVVPKAAEKASMVVTDKAYLDFLRRWRKKISESVEVPMVEVESDVIVPVEEASSKEEYAARTIRPKINEKLDEYLVPLEKRRPKRSSFELEIDIEELELEDLETVLSELEIDDGVKPVDSFTGGTGPAEKHLENFFDQKLVGYDELGNDPSKDHLSNLSPYLHFGQISPLYVALEVEKRRNEENEKDVEAFLEQLIVRRELAFNFVYYNKDYDSLECVPDWAWETLKDHEDDDREYIYSREEFEEAETHDEYWNAAQKEMLKTGKMHGYMRMYWGKKILEWSETPEEAYETALYLNNKYELDGRDPNGFAGVAWCFGKHDQGWKERDVYGKVRYMNANGLKRKFDMEEYLDKIEKL
ncbi:MAG: deoxyribodipyrimidine photo-lyase [Candidatus Natronoplasma sp.]